MAISRDQVDEIKSRVSIIDVAAERVNLSRHGSTMSCCCPFHQEKTPSCVLYEKTNSFYCFGCGTSGDVISFIRGTDNLSYVEAVQQLAQRAGITIDAKGAQLNQREQELRDRIRACNREAARYFFRSLTQDDEGSVGRTYLLNERGLSINRDMLMSGNSLVLATTGGGKSFHIKEDALQVALKGEADIFFVDPECEYVVATQRLGGTVISLSPSTPHRINPLEINADPDDRSSEPLKEKLEFIMSFCRILLMEDGNVLDGKMKSLLDRCVRKLYAPVVASGYTKPSPLLGDLYRMLKDQNAPEAQELALRMEIYTSGSYDMFAQPTNVDTQAHIIDYDLSKLGEGMNAVGMLIVLESIYSRLMDNWRKKRHTYIYIDEIMTIFRNPYAAQYFASLWQRIRKRGGYIIGATQNTTEILNSREARKLLENSYIITMLYQSAPDRDVLAEMFSLSEAQKQALAKEQYGTGLIKVGSTIVPFENDFPTDNPLYQLMSTKPSDGWGQVNEYYDV